MDLDMFYKIKDWALEGEMDGFDTLAADEQLGFDYMNLLKGAGGMMSGAGGMFGGGKGGGGQQAAPNAEVQRLAAQAAKAEASARTGWIVGGIALAVVALGGTALLMRPKVA